MLVTYIAAVMLKSGRTDYVLLDRLQCLNQPCDPTTKMASLLVMLGNCLRVPQ